MEYRYTGIILNKRNVGETDRICTVYTLEGGKVRSIAKGVRKPHAKLASSLENITLADITIIKSKGLGKITGSIVENNFSALKCDCDALLETFAGLNMFDKLVDFENPDPKVFGLLKNYLEAIEFCCVNGIAEKFLLLRLGFAVKLLDALGYTIEVNSCACCGKTLSQESLCFSSSAGGTLCLQCSDGNESAILPVRVNAIKMMRIFLKNNISALVKIQATREDCDSLHLVVDDFLKWNT
jgi:DNA repair protein RecO (recombination protein O)